MKKRTKKKTSKNKPLNPMDEAESFAVEQDIAVLLGTLVKKLSSFESKLDAVLNRVTTAPAVLPPQPQVSAPMPQQRREHPHRYTAICADCGDDCDIPFKPRPDRPVYCRACFAKRKSQRMMQRRGEVRPQVLQPHVVESPKPAEKKKKTVKKTAKRSGSPAKKKSATKKRAPQKKAPQKKSVKKTVKKKVVKKTVKKR